MARVARLSIALVPFILFACSSELRNPAIPGPVTDHVSLGQTAFEQSCSGCHASRDGFDLKSFGFSDTTIIRRAVHHVDTATARNIVTYIKTLSAPPNDRNVRLFQPGTPLDDDVQFAIALFGRDAWPDDLTTAQLVAMDPRKVQVAIRLPVWSAEGSDLDWMSDQPLPASILDYAGGSARAAIDGYYAAPTGDNLMRAVNALMLAVKASDNPAAPCRINDPARRNHRQCFEARRWTSSLLALHILRNGTTAEVGAAAHRVWWDVGYIARHSTNFPQEPIGNALENWVTWMHLGWMFDPSVQQTAYVGGAFRKLGLIRHAAFVALRSQVARPRTNIEVYTDLANAVRYAPPTWTFSVAAFGLRHARERLEAGDRPDPRKVEQAVASINEALSDARPRISSADHARLVELAQPVLAALAQHAQQ